LRAIRLEAEGRRRLGPNDKLRAVIDRLTGQPKVVVEDQGGVRRVPLLPLIDVPLQETDLHGFALASQLPAGKARRTPSDDRRENERDCRDPPVRPPDARRSVRFNRQSGACRAHRRDEPRHAVHADHARDLRNGKNRDLTVSEKDPWESAQQIRAANLGGHPHERRGEKRTRSIGHDQPTADDGENRGKQCQVRDEGTVDENGHGDVKIAVQDHHPSNPVQRPGEAHQAGRQPENEGPAETTPF
jgi:hypothetical protein